MIFANIAKKNQSSNRNPHELRNTYLQKDRNFINRPIQPSSDSLERDRNQMRETRYSYNMPPPPPDGYRPPPPSRDGSFYARRSSYPSPPEPLGTHAMEKENNIVNISLIIVACHSILRGKTTVLVLIAVGTYNSMQ